MSGIAGIYNLDGRPVPHSSIESMISCLAHRGPDGRGIWCRESVGIGHCMLWTTPESVNERQPLLNSAANLILAADARIDNREELSKLLGLGIRSWRTITDGQLILYAYERWKSDCAAKLIGDFAFAIWDASEQQLFCARDSVGVKPFYYYRTSGCFAFASEIKALLALKEVSNELNEAHLVRYLNLDFEDGESTFYRNIRRLPAAHTITVTQVEHSTRKYWSLDPQYEIRLNSDEEYILAFQEIFTGAVACRLRSNSAVGTTLSGGLDSSSIACTARRILSIQNHLPLSVYSAVYPNLPQNERNRIDEKEYIDLVTSTGGFLPHEIPVDQISPMIETPAGTSGFDEPYFAPTLYLFWAIYRTAHQSGTRILLDGTDGDRTVSHGLDYLADLARTGKWNSLYHEAQELSRTGICSGSIQNIVWQNAIKPNVPNGWLRTMRRIRNAGRKRSPQLNLINPEFAKRTNLAFQPIDHSNPVRVVGKTSTEKHWHELNTALIPLSLEMFDLTASRFSLEVRFPFFDRRLLEFCLAVPANQKLSNGWTRAILRRSMDGLLPEKIQYRTSKADLLAGVGTRLLACEQSRMEQIFLSDETPLRDYVDILAMRGLYQRFCASPEGNHFEVYLIFCLLNLGSWLSMRK